MTATVLTNLHKATPAAIAEAGEVLRRGGLVAFPTETVYGLGANAEDDKAVASIFAAKGRPRFNPLIVHLRDLAQAETLVEISPAAHKLAGAFWPGPLTLVLPRRKDSRLSLLVSAGLDTVAVRVPRNAIAQRLLAASERPIAAPSANASGSVSPTLASHVAESLGGRVDMILDGGAADAGIESTIIGFGNGQAVLLRPGAIGRDAIEAVAGKLGARVDCGISAPGQLESHYAPQAKLRLNAQSARKSEALLAFGPAPRSAAAEILNLSPSGDVVEAAANLFAMLRTLDKKHATIAVMPIPDDGIGEAINDRLRRAAAPRSAP
ncbi:MAG TPA: L-threonylcarbamoyladenylate synthase [Rhizomicrobium sp.]|jgi:L-threonylcarbamoyladenylate synthase